MATFSGAAAAAVFTEALNGTTGNVTPGTGSNRYVFGGVAACRTFGGVPTIDDCRYGGSGGTQLTKLAESLGSLNFTNGSVAAYGVAGSPETLTNLFGDWADETFGAGVGGAFYEGVDQAGPIDDMTVATGLFGDPTSSELATLVVPNCVDGQVVVAMIGMTSGSVSAAAFTAVAGTTIRAQAAADLVGVALLEATNVGGGNTTLHVNVNQGSANSLTWAILGGRLIDAGGGSAFNPLTGRGGAAAQPLAA